MGRRSNLSTKDRPSGAVQLTMESWREGKSDGEQRTRRRGRERGSKLATQG